SVSLLSYCKCVSFFQAEDGIRDFHVTGVQTCALPIYGQSAEGIQSRSMQVGGLAMHWGGVTPRFSPEDSRTKSLYGVGHDWPIRSEERRVGEGGRAQGWPGGLREMVSCVRVCGPAGSR